jgi:hypothetical protein
MPKCIFSEDEAGSKEHIWPQWLLARKDFGDFRLKRAGAPEVILKNGGQLIVKSVCGKCNNGWMSELEQEAMPLLIPMFEAQPITLYPSQQFTLAVWITKMAFLFDSTKGRIAQNLFYEKSEGLAFAKTRQIPQFTGIWIGSLDEEHRSIDGADFTMLSNDGTRIGEGSSVTLANERFVAQICSLRLKETPTTHTVLNVEPKPGEWSNMLLPIWPPAHQTIHWPPKVSFTNGSPNGYYHLMDRWRIGEEVLRINKHGVDELPEQA